MDTFSRHSNAYETRSTTFGILSGLQCYIAKLFILETFSINDFRHSEVPSRSEISSTASKNSFPVNSSDIVKTALTSVVIG
jgi:hypothetical protein